MRWLVVSLVVSVGLTVLVNVVIRLDPDLGRRLAERLAERAAPSTDDPERDDRRGRVLVPWRAMLVASIVLTVVVNLMIRIG